MKNTFFLLSAILVLMVSCKEVYTPKPRAYFRIYYPEHQYQIYDSNCAFRFEYPVYARIEPDRTEMAEPCWLNIHYLPFRAKLHLSYKKVINEDNFYKLTEDARTFVYKHTVKAEEIKEEIIKTNNTSGMFYELEGNTATAFQFFLTDSSRHFIRASLYFQAEAKRDSLQPVIDFIREDVDHMIRSFSWKNSNTIE